MADMTQAMRKLLKWEGGYSNNPKDPGGETNHGITKAVAVENGYTLSMKDIPPDIVEYIYKKKYWDRLSLDMVTSQGLAEQIMQAAVNQGVPRWQKYVQQICNELLPAGRRLTVDGIVGRNTASAINELADGYLKELSLNIYEKQMARYDEVIRNNPDLSVFRKGWANRAEDFILV